MPADEEMSATSLRCRSYPIGRWC